MSKLPRCAYCHLPVYLNGRGGIRLPDGRAAHDACAERAKAEMKPAMTIKAEHQRAVIDKVQAVAAKSGDPEAAHAAEDDVWQMTLEIIAEHSTDDAARSLARQALLTYEIKFERWSA